MYESKQDPYELQSATPAVRAIKVRLNSGSFIDVDGEIREKEPQKQNPDYILVTGGLGYIGSHTVIELLREDEKVIIVDNLNNSNEKCLERLRIISNKPKSIIFYDHDVKDEKKMEELFKTFNIKSVIHFAAHKAVGESLSKPLLYYSNNLNGTVNILKLMNKYDVKIFVLSSSACVYGIKAYC